jgi:hypothetical protein
MSALILSSLHRYSYPLQFSGNAIRLSWLLDYGKSGGDVGEVTQPLREVAEQLVMLSIVFLREEADRCDAPG